MKRFFISVLFIAVTATTVCSDLLATQRTVTTSTRHRRGWSRRAKGAAIGGGSGAVIGAVAGGGEGALIGGVLGAGAGYVIGNETDKNKSHAKGRTVRRRKVVTNDR